ncbi:MAG: enoyl-CoA hydratase/isomerase family protein [Comamonadaceae bacterium]|nr:enoyl-CoA hydratase/isomerase family protein [Comamonadaceae bacterium]
MTEREAAEVEIQRRGGVAVLTLNRPHRRNAMDLESRKLFAELVEEVVHDEAVRVIVLTGRGGHFSAGGDINSMKGGNIEAEAGRVRMRNALKKAELLYGCDKPVIAAVEGCAYGGGFGLALQADMIIASQTARFCMSFVKMGLMPDNLSMYTLPRIVGVQRAKALMMSAREIGADDALKLGIAAEVVAEGEALARALEIANALANASPAINAMMKAGLNNSLSSDLRAMSEYEATAQGIAFSSQFHRRAVEDFLARRPPQFRWPAARDALRKSSQEA